MSVLSIKNLSASVENKPILSGINLEIEKGEVHAIMGPNGSGKSTLVSVLAGKPGYQVTSGTALFDGQDLLAMPAEVRARAGLFVGFQYPVELPGVNNLFFLKAAVNAARKHRGLPEYDAIEFLALAKEKMRQVKLDEALAQRAVNVGFSGGEKKRNEIFQMALLAPKLAVLDETDSGLDIDALSAVAEGINAQRGPEVSMLLITHYQRLLDHVKPDRVHVLVGGKIVRSGEPSLALELEERGYAEFLPASSSQRALGANGA